MRLLQVSSAVTPRSRRSISCKAAAITQYIFEVLDLLAVACTSTTPLNVVTRAAQLLTRSVAFTTTRVWALHGKINKVVVLTFFCSMFVPCVNIVSGPSHLAFAWHYLTSVSSTTTVYRKYSMSMSLDAKLCPLHLPRGMASACIR